MENDNNKAVEIDDNLKNIIKNANASQLSKEEIAKLLEENKDRLNFKKLIDSIDLQMKKYVVFTDGKEQLVYEDGEFFVESVVDASIPRKKKKRSEARDMYLEYFIKYQINPFIKQKELNATLHQISKKIEIKENTKESIDDISIGENSSEDDIKRKLAKLKEKENKIKQQNNDNKQKKPRKPRTKKEQRDILD